MNAATFPAWLSMVVPSAPATVTNAQFIADLFGPMVDDEMVWVNAFHESPKSEAASWAGGPLVGPCPDAPTLNTYFSVSTLCPIDGEVSRRTKHFSSLVVVVLDDAGECDIAPTYKLQTSPGKYHLGFKLTNPVTDIGVARRLHQELTKGGRIPADTNGNNIVRYVRLPVGSNNGHGTPFAHVLEVFDPGNTFSLDELIDALGLDADYILNGAEEFIGTEASGQADPEVTMELAGDWLDLMNPDGGRKPWIDDGMALHHQFGDAGFDLWDTHSQRSKSKYPGAREMLKQWNSFGKNNRVRPITIRSLRAKAIEAGWRSPPPDLSGVFGSVGAPQQALEVQAPTVTATNQLTTPPAQHQAPQIVPMQQYHFNLDSLGPVEWIVDGFMRAGITVMAGETGVGKTSQLVPLCCHVAHLVNFIGMGQWPTLRRKIVYFTEDPEQVESVLYGLCQRMGGNPAEFRDWFIVIPSKRTEADKLQHFITYARQVLAYRNDKGFMVEPLIVLDTANATIELDNENDNAEVGRAIGLLKEVSYGASLLIVAHTPKALSRADAESLSARGAGAWEADAHATMVMFKDDKLPYRVMMSKKRRFEADFTELHFMYHSFNTIVETPWGGPQARRYSFCTPSIADKEKRTADKAAVSAGKESELRSMILDYIRANAPTNGFITGRRIYEELAKALSADKQISSKTFYAEIKAMKDEQILDAVEVTSFERQENNLHHLVKERLIIVQS